MIELRDISKFFGKTQALSHVGFKLEKGEILGIAGLNGAGKSTLISVASGIIAPDSGTVEHMGFDIKKLRRSKPLSIGYVPQETALFDNLCVLDNLRFWAALEKKHRDGEYSGSSAHDRIQTALIKCSLVEQRRMKISQLSGGMKHRANIAAALVMDPDVLVMDEPTAGLDVKNRKDILLFIKSLIKAQTESPQSQSYPQSVIFTSHQAGDLELICDRIILLDRGKLVFDGKTSQLSAHFTNYFKNYFNINPDFNSFFVNQLSPILQSGNLRSLNDENNNDGTPPLNCETLTVDDILYLLSFAS